MANNLSLPFPPFSLLSRFCPFLLRSRPRVRLLPRYPLTLPLAAVDTVDTVEFCPNRTRLPHIITSLLPSSLASSPRFATRSPSRLDSQLTLPRSSSPPHDATAILAWPDTHSHNRNRNMLEAVEQRSKIRAEGSRHHQGFDWLLSPYVPLPENENILTITVRDCFRQTYRF